MPAPAETRTNEKNDRPIAVVLGQFAAAGRGKPFRHQPETGNGRRQYALRQKEAANHEERRAKRAAGTRARKQVAQSDNCSIEQEQPTQGRHHHHQVDPGTS